MNGTFNLLSMIFIFGALQGFFLSILLFVKYRNLKANRILVWLILLYSLFIVQNYLFSQQNLSLKYPYILMLLDGFPLLFGPLHLMYVGLLTDTRMSFAKIRWFHFLPFILFRLYYLQVFFIPKEELLNIFAQIDAGNIPFHILLSGTITAVQGLVYMTAALFVLREYAEKIKLTFSSLDKINLSYLRFFTFLALFVWLIVLLDNIFIVTGKDAQWSSASIPFLTSVYVYAIGYIGMFKSEIFTQSSIIENIHDAQSLSRKETSSSLDNQKYRKSGLTPEKANGYLKTIQRAMVDDKMFTDPEITLSDFSRSVGISSYYISEIINTRLNQNFFDFVNHYRINKVKEDLLDESKSYLTILGIAMDAGFSSKSGFNAIFKRMTGKTPSEYRNEKRPVLLKS